MSDERRFHISDVLTVTHDRLVSSRGVEGLYDILGFMAGEDVYTHQLPRIGREAAAAILKQYPELADISDEGVNADNWRKWIDGIAAEYGEEIELRPMTLDEHERIDPLSEAAEHFSPDKIIVVRTDTQGDG